MSKQASPPVNWQSIGAGGQSYVPVDFKYAGIAANGATAYVKGAIVGTPRNDFGGWVGMQLVVGANSLSVTQLGRMMASGNSAVHALKLVNASDGTDLPGAATAVVTKGGTVGQFQYGALAAPVTLVAGGAYLLVAQEALGGDVWYDYNTVLTTTPVAADITAIWGRGIGDWHPIGATDQSYVPVDFEYVVTATANSTAYVTGAVMGPIRNDFSGWVGMQIVVGASPITVSQLGRIVTPGNTATHTIKLVMASDGTDLTGGTTTVATAGGASGQFRYGMLPGSIVLAAGATYFLVTQETSGGDAWYDYNCAMTTTTAAADTAAVWGRGVGDWHSIGGGGQSYVPVDFKY